MADNKSSREKLLKRRDEIMAQFENVNHRLRTELDRDPEEQAIEIEQDEVAITMEQKLRTELAGIEDRLLDMNDA